MEANAMPQGHEEDGEEFVLLDLDVLSGNFQVPPNAPYVFTGLDTLNPVLIIDDKIKLEVSNCAINIWIKHLYDEMDKTETAKPVQFGNFEMIRPSKVALKEGPQYISKLLGMIELGQIILIPYNPSFHWVLLAIDIVRCTIYYLDPQGNNPTDELMQIVNQGIRVYQSLHSNNKSGSVTWVSVKCPMQPGSFECGYYVMKYMQQIVTNVNILKDKFKGINEYTLEDITQLRDDWAIYVAHIITQYNEENTNDKDNIAIVR